MMLNLAHIQELMQKLKDWSLEEHAIVKDCTFNEFKEAAAFVTKVAEIAEKHNHHPTILWDFNVVHLTLTTHEEHGITEKDFIVAKEIDTL